MSTQDLYAIIGSNVVAIAVIGGLIGTFFWRTTARIDAARRAADARADKDRAEAAADRRTFQVAMDDFRKEMQRLAERQSHLEGARTAGD